MASLQGAGLRLRGDAAAAAGAGERTGVAQLGRCRSRAAWSCRGGRRAWAAVGLEGRFLVGGRLRPSVSERRQLWRSDGPGRCARLRVVSALSQVPEKPLGLYDPSFDKDSCGVGFVAELSGEYNRKTVG